MPPFSASTSTSSSPLPRLLAALQRLFSPSFTLDIRSLGIFRVLFGLFLFCDIAIKWYWGYEFFTDYGILPRAAMVELTGSIENWSLHAINGSALWMHLLFILHLGLIAAFTVGFHTRWVAVAVWVLTLSLQTRNPMILSAAELLVRLCLFWTLFLPMGDWLSLDAKRRTGTATPSQVPQRSVTSLVSAAYILQVGLIYWTTLFHKHHPMWYEEKLAVYYALSLDEFARPIGIWFWQLARDYQPFGFDLMQLANDATLLVEGLAPTLWLIPFFSVFFRTVGVLGIMGLHLGLGSMMVLGIFPFIGAISTIPMIPGWWWDKVKSWRLQPPTAKPPSASQRPSLLTWLRAAPLRTLRYVFLSVCCISILWWNAVELGATSPFTSNGEEYIPESVKSFNRLLSLDQNWNMFSPPPRGDGWYVIEGTLTSGRKVDVWRHYWGNGDLTLDWDKPTNIPETYRHDAKWHKYMANLRDNTYEKHRLHFGRFLCREWNSDYNAADPEALQQFDIHFFTEHNLPNYRVKEDITKDTIWYHQCYSEEDREKAATAEREQMKAASAAAQAAAAE